MRMPNIGCYDTCLYTYYGYNIYKYGRYLISSGKLYQMFPSVNLNIFLFQICEYNTSRLKDPLYIETDRK